MRYSIRKRSTTVAKLLRAESTLKFGNFSYKSLTRKPPNPDVTDRDSAGDAVVYIVKQGCFSFAYILPVKVCMLYSTALQ